MRDASDTPFGGSDEPPGSGGDRSVDRLTSLSSRVELEKELALREPGPSWREWALFTGLKPWLGVGFLIADAWIVAAWLEAGSYLGLSVSLAVAVYLEFLLYRYLWYRPDPADAGRRASFRPTWSRPVRYGRWTPEAERMRAGLPLEGPSAEPGPDLREFL
jgi:hypothetical protein